MNVFVLFLFLLFSAAGGCNDVTDVIEFIMLPPCCLTIKVIRFLISYTKEGVGKKRKLLAIFNYTSLRRYNAYNLKDNPIYKYT